MPVRASPVSCYSLVGTLITFIVWSHRASANRPQLEASYEELIQPLVNVSDAEPNASGDTTALDIPSPKLSAQPLPRIQKNASDAPNVFTIPSSSVHAGSTVQMHNRFHPSALLATGKIYKDPQPVQTTTASPNSKNTTTLDMITEPMAPGEPSLGALLKATETSTLVMLLIVFLIMALMSPGALPVQKVLNKYFGSVPSGVERPKGNIYRLLAGVGPAEIGIKAWRRLRIKAYMIALMQVYIPLQLLSTLSATYGRPVGILSYYPPPLKPNFLHISCFIFWFIGEIFRIASLISLANLVCTNAIGELAEESANDCHLIQRRIPFPGENKECEKIIPYLRWKERNGVPLDDDRKIAWIKVVERLVCFSSPWVPDQEWVRELHLPDCVPTHGSSWPQEEPLPDDERLPGHREASEDHVVNIVHVAEVLATFFLAGRDSEAPAVPPCESAHVRLAAAYLLQHSIEKKTAEDPERTASTAVMRRCLPELESEVKLSLRAGDSDRVSGLEQLTDVLEAALYQLTDGAEGMEHDGALQREPFDEEADSTRERWWVIVSLSIKIVSALTLEIAAFYKLCTLSGAVDDMVYVVMALLFVNDLDDRIMTANPDFTSMYRQNVFMQISDKCEEGPDHSKPCHKLMTLAKAVDKVGVPIASLIMVLGCIVMFTARWRNKLTGEDLPGVLKLT